MTVPYLIALRAGKRARRSAAVLNPNETESRL
jgi:hypothetical protein